MSKKPMYEKGIELGRAVWNAAGKEGALTGVIELLDSSEYKHRSVYRYAILYLFGALSVKT